MDQLGVLKAYLLPYRRVLGQALIVTVAATAVGLAPPLIIAAIVDRLLVAGQDELFWPLIIALAGVPIGHHMLRMVTRLTISNTASKLVFDVRSGLYRHITALPVGFFDRHPTGLVLERLMGDVNKLQQLITGQSLQLLTDLITAGFSITVMMALNWKLALLLMSIIPLYLLNHRYFVRRIRACNESLRGKMDDVSGHLQERLAGTALVKSFGMERGETRNFVVQIHAALQHSSQARGLMIAFSNTAELVQWFGRTFIYLLGCYLVIRSSMSYGQVLAFTTYAMYLLGPAVRFSQLANQIEQTFVSIRRIKEILAEPVERARLPGSPRVGRLRGQIRIEDLWFAYKPGQWVLEEINLEIPAGTTVALVGRTGCGKTTLASLLYRFYEPNRGRILLDGYDIARLGLNELRRQLSIVPQEPVLFQGTAADNIAYGQPDASREQIIRAAKLAEIHDVLENLPAGYDTPLGQAGAKLSVGQKQRLVIARAVLTDPVVLLMDEATSSLDTESERLIHKALRNVMANRTCLVIAHRLSTIERADIIVVMEDGKIIETGNHRELLARPDGYYRRLYETQFAPIAAGPAQRHRPVRPAAA